jgi:hypothetical protein
MLFSNFFEWPVILDSTLYASIAASLDRLHIGLKMLILPVLSWLSA